MATLSVLFKKDIMEQVRSKKIMILAIIFLFLALASPISAKLMPQIFKGLAVQGVQITIPEPTYKDAVDQFVKNASQLVIFILIFVVAGAVSDEKVRKTLEMVLVKPVSRQSFVVSKFLAYFSTVTLFYLAGALVFYLYTISVFTAFSFINFLVAAVLTLIYILLVLSVTIFASTLARSAAVAGVIGLFSSFIFSSILGVIPRVENYAPGYVLANYSKIILNGWDGKFLPPTLISVFLIAAFMAFAVLFFRGQEVER